MVILFVACVELNAAVTKVIEVKFMYIMKMVTMIMMNVYSALIHWVR